MPIPFEEEVTSPDSLRARQRRLGTGDGDLPGDAVISTVAPDPEAVEPTDVIVIRGRSRLRALLRRLLRWIDRALRLDAKARAARPSR